MMNLLCSSLRAADNSIIQLLMSALADLLLCDGCKYNEISLTMSLTNKKLSKTASNIL